MKETVLLTGCTSGIGLHLAHQFAANGHSLVLVAPDEGELGVLAEELKTRYGIAARWIAKDLEAADSAEEIFDELQAEGIPIEILANNAGHGFHGRTWEIPIETHLSVIRLNIEAVVRLTNLFLPPMVARGRGKIFITASVAGFEAGPTVNVYHASKAFVLSYAEGLSVELEKTGVTVTALCPGATDTDFFPKGNMEGVVGFQKGNLMDPKDVAEAGYNGLMSDDLIIIPGMLNKTIVASRRFLSEHALAKISEKQYEDVPPEKRERTRGDKESPPQL
ncbi:SDR family oxidoreductase [Luteolibacter flavescens]|uniref:SDR family oxidoreductase n=1 Tax=Luteolibacter flavescens TaxID=1859460 RepID=A0ABT3FNA0_9BACT|nr:SDR family oxidoreductase [Luteolibacter flavescens]MCW1885046.1 SDR family oxidoreductase [Luteolibacter flavescens]